MMQTSVWATDLTPDVKNGMARLVLIIHAVESYPNASNNLEAKSSNILSCSSLLLEARSKYDIILAPTLGTSSPYLYSYVRMSLLRPGGSTFALTPKNSSSAVLATSILKDSRSLDVQSLP